MKFYSLVFDILSIADHHSQYRIDHKRINAKFVLQEEHIFIWQDFEVEEIDSVCSLARKMIVHSYLSLFDFFHDISVELILIDEK
jgi:hypothetical protein